MELTATCTALSGGQGLKTQQDYRMTRVTLGVSASVTEAMKLDRMNSRFLGEITAWNSLSGEMREL